MQSVCSLYSHYSKYVLLEVDSCKIGKILNFFLNTYVRIYWPAVIACDTVIQFAKH